MANAVKISDSIMNDLRESAALQSRSLTGQAEHWLNLGRLVERDPQFGYAKIEQALRGLIAPMDLSESEQEQYFDRLAEGYAKPSPTADAFFKEMRERGEGVGMDDAGTIVYGANEKSKPL